MKQYNQGQRRGISSWSLWLQQTICRITVGQPNDFIRMEVIIRTVIKLDVIVRGFLEAAKQPREKSRFLLLLLNFELNLVRVHLLLLISLSFEKEV